MSRTRRRWITHSILERGASSSRFSPSRVRLRLESLENRTIPAVYSVTTTADVVDANDSLLSLREAVLAANASIGVADTIVLPAGNYVLTRTGAKEDLGLTGDLDITDTLTILGDGASTTVIDGNQTDRIIDVRSTSLTFPG